MQIVSSSILSPSYSNWSSNSITCCEAAMLRQYAIESVPCCAQIKTTSSRIAVLRSFGAVVISRLLLCLHSHP